MSILPIFATDNSKRSYTLYLLLIFGIQLMRRQLLALERSKLTSVPYPLKTAQNRPQKQKNA